ncbi:MAG: hypothetical protein ACXVH3_36125 [Solirubrobacteraceae bacterium]
MAIALRSTPTKLPGLLLFAAAGGLLLGAFTAPLVSVPAVLALLLIGAFGSSAVACKLGGMIAVVIGVRARCVSLATASRSSGGREYLLKRPLTR